MINMNLIPAEGQTLKDWFESMPPEDQQQWLPSQSLKTRLALLPEHTRQSWLAECDEQTMIEMGRDEWWFVARPKQVPDLGKWMVYLALAGRGFGKSKAGSEWIIQRALDIPTDASGFPTEHLVIAETLSDARIVCAEGPAGILRVLERKGLKKDVDYTYVKSPKPRITLLETGVKIFFEGADGADVGRGYNLTSLWADEICVAAGEPVITARGSVPIEGVVVGDQVWTRSGWRAVRHAWKTATDAEIIEVWTQQGCVRLTPAHRVWTDEGWASAATLKPGSIIFSCSLTNPNGQPPQPSTSGTELPGTTTSEPAITTAATDSCYTEPCGSKPTEPSQTASKSTMSTMSAGTIGSTTSSCSPSMSTEFEPGPNGLTRASSRDDPLSRLHEDCIACGPSVSRSLSPANSVATSSTPLACEQPSAPTPAARNSSGSLLPQVVLHVVKDGSRADVYDLEVEGEPEFFAGSGSILVHNCKWSDPYGAWYEGILPSLRADLPDDHPRAFVTTTPKPITLLKEWLAVTDGSVQTVRGSTFENILNLSVQVIRELHRKYQNTSLGRQELYGEMLDKGDGILFTYSSINDWRRPGSVLDNVIFKVVGVDPGLTGDDDGDECGIVVVGKDAGQDLYVIEDASMKITGRDAAIYAWKVFIRNQADVLVYESNLGKAWMEQVFKDAYRELQKQGLFPEHTSPPLKGVFSTVGKKLRAEPVAMRYEQGHVHHVGRFDVLETQMLTFDPLAPNAKHNSPDRLDALVHACRHLMDVEKMGGRIISSLHRPLGYDWDPYSR